MIELSIDQTCQSALFHLQNHRRAEAQTLFRQVLSRDPRHDVATHMLGILAWQNGDTAAAADLLRQSIALRPNAALYHLNLGKLLSQQGDANGALSCFTQALELDPHSVEAHFHLGAVKETGGDYPSAAAHFRQAIQRAPTFVRAHYGLGNVLRAMFDLQGARLAFEEAIRVAPTFAPAYNNLGNVLKDLGQPDAARTAYENALRLDPNFAPAFNNLGIFWQDQSRLDQAIQSFSRAVELAPQHPSYHNNLANALSLAGLAHQATREYARALELNPQASTIHSNLLYTMHLDPAVDARQIHDANKEWNRRHAEPFRMQIKPHDNHRATDRRLRIGYLSPDFRVHAVGRFMLPLLTAHDREAVEVFCYSHVTTPDNMTACLQAQAAVWRDITRSSDDAVAQTIRDDQIDILVDLAMHAAACRPLIFARKPAPVQVAYLAYVSTTGMEAMDYRFSDPHLDPPGTDESIYTEKTVRLPRTYWCYPAPDHAPDVGNLPALMESAAGVITFGCLNNFSKISEPTIALWAKILLAVKNSRLILHAPEGSHRQRLTRQLQTLGVNPETCQFIGRLPQSEYLATYDRIDIALDPTPYSGGTTTCDALWMGVPVITLAGATAVGRGGVSLLSNVGLPDWIAYTHEVYIHIAASWAGNLKGLSNLRHSLRQKMRTSPLTDAAQFAKDIETAYRHMWLHWANATKSNAKVNQSASEP